MIRMCPILSMHTLMCPCTHKCVHAHINVSMHTLMCLARSLAAQCLLESLLFPRKQMCGPSPSQNWRPPCKSELIHRVLKKNLLLSRAACGRTTASGGLEGPLSEDAHSGPLEAIEWPHTARENNKFFLSTLWISSLLQGSLQLLV